MEKPSKEPTCNPQCSMRVTLNHNVTYMHRLQKERDREHLVFISKEKSLVHDSYKSSGGGDGDGSHSQSLGLLYT